MELDLHSNCKFGDFELGEWVTVAHLDDREPDVNLWRAKITGVHDPTPSSKGAYDLFIRELVKSVGNFQPDKIFKRSLQLPAV